jgi:formylglycine-generating enzyme
MKNRMKNKKIAYLMLLCLCLTNTLMHAQSLKKAKVTGGKMLFKENKIAISSFNISKYEITNAQYVKFLNAKKIASDGVYDSIQIINSTSPDLQIEFKNKKWISKLGKENYPMVMVSYYGANAYCNWTGGRLPSESEWYFAASGGINTKHYTYAGSNELELVGWFSKNSEGHSHKVGEKKPNELGIYDMSGRGFLRSHGRKLVCRKTAK